MFSGLETVAHLMDLSRFREQVYLEGTIEGDQPKLEKAMVNLYAEIIKYQGLAICHLHRKSPIRGIQDTLKLNDWKSQLEEVESKNKHCEEIAKLADAGETREHHRETREHHRKTLSQMAEINDEQKSRWSDKDRNSLLQTLASISSDWRADKDANPVRVKGTCEWLLKDTKFRQWRDATYSSLLWVFAEPGCGKSVLSKFLIDEKHLIDGSPNSSVCYFFFKDGQENRQSAQSALSALLHQFFTQQSDRSGVGLMDHAVSVHRMFGSSLKDKYSELWDMLVHAAQSRGATQVVCVLDALDECDKNASQGIINSIKGFYRKPKSRDEESCRLKFLITSRPYQDQTTLFKELGNSINHLRLDRDSNSDTITKELELVIDDRVSQLDRNDFNKEAQDKIIRRLGEINSRNFLWLDLAMENIEASCEDLAQDQNLDSVLSDLNDQGDPFDQYEKMLNRAKGRAKGVKSEQTFTLLQIVLASTRPLKVEEASVALCMALRLKKDPASCTSIQDIEPWPPEKFKTLVRSLCGLVVSVSKPTLTLIHQTAREFLVNPSRDPKRKWQGSINIAEAHGILSQVCMRYLSFEVFLCSDCNCSIPEAKYESKVKSANSHAFFEYAARNWCLHYDSQDGDRKKSFRYNALSLCEGRRLWFHDAFVYGSRSPVSSSPFGIFPFSEWTSTGIASAFGVDTVVEDSLAQGVNINAHAGPKKMTALQIASILNQRNIVHLLVQRDGLDINLSSEIGSAVYLAVDAGKESIVETLVHADADINGKDKWYRSDLEVAMRPQNHEEMIDALFTEKNHPAAELYGSALLEASRVGLDASAEALLRNSTVYDPSESRVKLWNASYSGIELDVNKLSDQNTTLGVKDFRAALEIAACKGHRRILEALLGHVRPSAKTLEEAVVRRHEEFIIFLLQHMEPSIKSQQAAVPSEHEQKTMQRLTEDMEPTDTTWRAAMQWGHSIVLSLLLQYAKPSPQIMNRMVTMGVDYQHEELLKTLFQHVKPKVYSLLSAADSSNVRPLSMVLEHTNSKVEWGLKALTYKYRNREAVEYVLKTVSFDGEQLLEVAKVIDEQAQRASVRGWKEKYAEISEILHMVRDKAAELQQRSGEKREPQPTRSDSKE